MSAITWMAVGLLIGWFTFKRPDLLQIAADWIRNRIELLRK